MKIEHDSYTSADLGIPYFRITNDGTAYLISEEEAQYPCDSSDPGYYTAIDALRNYLEIEDSPCGECESEG